MKRVLAVDIEGLNLILGGGIPVLKRYEDLGESTTLLLRGPPGSGKTIFGVQLAGSLGRTLGCDVAYGCIELLPPELAAQHAGIKREGIAERVLVPEFSAEQPTSSECRIFADTLNIKSLENEPTEPAQLVPALERLLAGIEKSGGRPRILVVDSLSDGYHLGASAPRILADELCKMAVQRGLILILLEEITDTRPSVWSFATDMVIELDALSEETTRNAAYPFERRLTVIKNRFGPCEVGYHRFSIRPSLGIRVLPHPRAYLSRWAPEVILRDHKPLPQNSQGWVAGWNPTQGWPAFRNCITMVYGNLAPIVYQAAMKLGVTTTDQNDFAGGDVFLDFGNFGRHTNPTDVSSVQFVDCGDPFLSGDWLLSASIAALENLDSLGTVVRRLLVGNLQSIQTFLNPNGIWHALAILMFTLQSRAYSRHSLRNHRPFGRSSPSPHTDFRFRRRHDSGTPAATNGITKHIPDGATLRERGTRAATVSTASCPLYHAQPISRAELHSDRAEPLDVSTQKASHLLCIKCI